MIDETSALEQAIEHWLRLLNPAHHDPIVERGESDLMITIPAKRLELIKREMRAFMAGFNLGRKNNER